MVDAGVPDGVNGSLVFRPVSRLQLHAGGSYNLISPGVRVGASVRAFRWWLSPSLTIEGGRYFTGDANPVVMSIAGEDPQSPILSEVSYTYANAHVGLEFGYERATLYVHAGFSKIQTTLKNVNEELNANNEDQQVEFRSDPVINIFGPSARIGLIIYL